MRKYKRHEISCETSVLGWGLPLSSSVPEIGTRLSLPHCCPCICQGLFQECLRGMAIEKEAGPPGRGDESSAKALDTIGCQWWKACLSLQDQTYFVTHFCFSTHWQGLDLWSRSHNPFSPSPGLHHLLVFLRTGYRVRSLSLSLYFHSTYHDIINCNPDFPRAFSFNS